jgi:hypothetical protein
MANPFDQFDAAPEASGPLVVTVAPNRKAAGNPFDQFDAPPPSTWDKVKSTAADVAQALPTGIIKGAIGFASMPGELAGLLGKGADAAAEYITGQPLPAKLTNAIPESVGYGRLTKDFEGLTGKLYEPQTTPGRYVEKVGEFIPGAGRSLANQLRYAVAPAVTSETVGDVLKGTPYEHPARAATAVLTGGLAALTNRPATAASTIAGGMRGVDDATITAAGQLMHAAQTRGVALTWPEAIAQASGGGGRGLTNLQRVVEGSQGGGDTMGNFMAQRPAQIEAAGRQAFDTIAPQSQAPSAIGPAIGRAADETIQDATGLINRATRPAYQAAEVQRVGPQVHGALMSDPLFAQVFNEVRGNAALNRTIANLPDDSVGVIDMVQRRMREQAAGAAVPGHANSGNTIAAAFQDARTAPIAAAETVTGSRAATATQPAQVGSYEAARAQQEALRRQYLEPLMAGPLGKLANRDIGTKQAIEALFPTSPLAGSAREIVDTVGALARRNSMAARQLVRTHVETVFNEATQALQAGPNQFGGAGFVAVLRGNTQQAENLAAAIQGVGGPQVLQGFDEFLNVLSATGQRQRIGSQTAFNQEAQDALKRGGAIGEAANAVATAGIKLPGRIKEAYEQWRLGRNTQQIAQLFTDPNALATFRRLAQAAPGSSQAQALTARLASLALQARP